MIIKLLYTSRKAHLRQAFLLGALTFGKEIKFLASDFQENYQSETRILVKQEFAETGEEVFEGTHVKISTDAERYLEGTIGTAPFLTDFVEKTVEEWTEEVKTLSVIARTQSHATNATLIYSWPVIQVELPSVYHGLGSIVSLRTVTAAGVCNSVTAH